MNVYLRSILVLSLFWPITLLEAQDSTIVVKLNNIRFCNQFSGSDAGAKISACITDLPSTGGTADATGFEGAQTIASDIFTSVTTPVQLRLGGATYALSVNVTIPANITLEFSQGSILSLNSGVTLTSNGSIIAPIAQIFSGAGTVVLGNKVHEVYPHWWGAASGSDSTTAFQAAFTASGGRPVIAPAGTYIISSTLTYNTTGNLPGLRLIADGMQKTIFDNRVASGAMISLDGSATLSTYAYGAVLSDFKITTTTSPATSHGIQLRSQWAPTIERVWMTGLTGDGIRIKNDASDPDSTNYLTINQCIIQLMTGWGFRCLTPPLTGLSAMTASGFLKVVNSHITQNTAGGVYLSGMVSVEFSQSSVSTNAGAGGIILPYENVTVSQQPSHVVLRDCETDGNTGYNIDIQAVAEMQIINHKMISASGIPAVGISIGRLAFTTNVYVTTSRVRLDSGAFTAYSIGANAYYTRIEDTSFSVNAGTLTKYSDAGAATTIREEGTFRRPQLLAISTATASSSYTPDLYAATVHRVAATTAGMFTINAPSYSVGTPAAVNGAELILRIANGSVGDVTFTFNGMYVIDGFKAPAAGLFTTARFVYNSADSLWVQVGAWSAPGTTKFTTGTGSYTPDLGVAATHRILVTAAGAFTVVNPAKTGGTLTNGDELNLIVGNTSGGAITVTFGAAYTHGGYTDPATSLQKSARFVYNSGAWYLIGAWSPAF